MQGSRFAVSWWYQFQILDYQMSKLGIQIGTNFQGLWGTNFQGSEALIFKGCEALIFKACEALISKACEALIFKGCEALIFKGCEALIFKGCEALASRILTYNQQVVYSLCLLSLHLEPKCVFPLLVSFGLWSLECWAVFRPNYK
jgi:hypothetical protein